MNQTQAIKNYLLAGNTLTSAEAFEKFGCTRLAAKIFNLKKAGYDIDMFWREGVNRYGKPTYYGVYKCFGRTEE